MRVRVQIKPPTGPAFTPGAMKSAINRAKSATLSYGKGAIAAITPVDTGLLESSWETDWGEDESTIYNEVPYSIYVEEGTSRMAGRFMAQRSVPAIADYFADEISKNLDALN
jgi:hypothetical protein